MSITLEKIQEYKERFNKEDKNIQIKRAVISNGIEGASMNDEVARKHTFVFSDITDRGKITNQKRSGRCWMFASLNTARVELMKKYNMETFEFSQNYTFFWDKLEKANYFLDSIIDTSDMDVDSRLVRHILADPLQDGGQWDMFAGILEKYGAVPKSAMPETYHSSNSGEMVDLLTSYLRYYAYQLRQEKDKDKQVKLKDNMLYNIYNLLVKSLGMPPKEVEYEYRDKDGKFHRMPKMTPQEFFKETVGWNLKDKISIINAPTTDKPYGKAYTIKYLGSVKEGQAIRYINAPMEVLTKAAVAAIKDNKPVFFGCDVGKQLLRNGGIMDKNMFAYEELVGAKLPWTKGLRLEYSESMLTHAMVLTGVNLDKDGNPKTWEVENSWNNESVSADNLSSRLSLSVSSVGKEGMYSMSHEWFEEFTYQIMVDKKYVDEKWLKALDEPVIELEPWDPLGSLAKLK